jgi:hypothetical protein
MLFGSSIPGFGLPVYPTAAKSYTFKYRGGVAG